MIQKRRKKVHHDLNKLKVKLASKTKIVAQLHAHWQTKNWMSSHIAKQDLGSPYEHGWQKDKIPIPVMYEVPMSFELIQQMTNTCTGTNVCKKTVFVKIKIWVSLRCVGAMGWQNVEIL